MPTPAPGLKRVPRWRTMISPPVTTSPANVFTPSLCALESRPLRLEPSPFSWAIAVLLLARRRRFLFRFCFRRLFASRSLGRFRFGRRRFRCRGRRRFRRRRRFLLRADLAHLDAREGLAVAGAALVAALG